MTRSCNFILLSFALADSTQDDDDFVIKSEYHKLIFVLS